jgi:hypothetical protein
VQDYKGSGPELLSLLARARTLCASDPRDKVFALLGIVRDVDLTNPLLAIEYQKRCSQVYLDAARYILEHSGNYDLLSYIDRGLVQSSYFLDLHDFISNSEAENSLVGNYRRKITTSQALIPSSIPNWNMAVDYVPNHLGSEDRVPTWVPNWNRGDKEIYHTRFTRTILSTLEEEDQYRTSQRQQMVQKGRTWTKTGHKMVSIGSVVGLVIEPGVAISVKGADEVRFQEARDLSGVNEQVCYQSLLNLWREHFRATPHLLPTLQVLNYPDEDFEMTRPLMLYPPVSIPRLLSETIPSGKLTVENHLLCRAKKTALWFNNQSMAGTQIIDEDSVVDGKRLGSYGNRRSSGQESLALLPVGTICGDFIVYLHGARVPFVARELKPQSTTLIDDDYQDLYTMAYTMNLDHTSVSVYKIEADIYSSDPTDDNLYKANHYGKKKYKGYSLLLHGSPAPFVVLDIDQLLKRKRRETHRMSGLALLPHDCQVADISFMHNESVLIITLRSCSKDFGNRVDVRDELAEILHLTSRGSINERAQILHLESKRSIDKNAEFMQCQVIGECIINDFEDIEEETFARFSSTEALYVRGPNHLTDCFFVIH